MRYTNYKYNPRVNNLLTILEKKPASRFTDLMLESGLKNGIISHYIKMMEKNSLIRTTRLKNQDWYFIATSDDSKDFLLIQLRKETSKKILVFLLDKESATFSELRHAINKSRPTLSLVLTNLVELNLIAIELGTQRRYRIKDRNATRQALMQIDPSFFDTMKDRFADAFSYY